MTAAKESGRIRLAGDGLSGCMFDPVRYCVGCGCIRFEVALDILPLPEPLATDPAGRGQQPLRHPGIECAGTDADIRAQGRRVLPWWRVTIGHLAPYNGGYLQFLITGG